MTNFNPKEIKEIPKIGVPKIGIFTPPLINVFGEVERKNYDIVESSHPYILWEDGSPVLWEDRTNVLLENQKMKIWRQARESASKA